MKSSIKLLFLLSLVSLFVLGCQNSPNFFEPESTTYSVGNSSANNVNEVNDIGAIYLSSREFNTSEYPIWAGQNMEIGILSIYNDSTYIYVQFSLFEDNDWLIEETHVHISAELAGIPATQNGPNAGIPIPGQFDYSNDHDPLVTEYTYAIELAPYDFECDQTIVIAAHAAVVMLDDEGEVIDDETAWGGDIPGPGPRWWFYAEYTIQCNGNGEPPEWEEETAYGGDYPGGGNAWWFYFDTEGSETQGIYAGQNLVEDASVTYSYDYDTEVGYITIDLGENMMLQDEDEAVKIQGYGEGELPDSRPASGLFTTYKGTDLEIEVDHYRYFVIHLDVLVCCGE